MSFRVVLDSRAWQDYKQIEAYFLENELAHLIPEFDDDLTSTLRFIGQNPLLRSESRPGVRHEALRVFKHNHVWFRVFEDIEHVEVFGILHDARSPRTVEERL